MIEPIHGSSTNLRHSHVSPDQIHAGDYLTGLRLKQRVVDEIPIFIRPPDLAFAYSVQDVIVDRLLTRQGGQAIGYKIACTSNSVQQLLNVDGPLFGQLLSYSSCSSPARVCASDFRVCVIEPEFAFRIGADVPSTNSGYDRHSRRPFISTILPAVEIVDHRFMDWSNVGGPSIAADNAIHGAWIYGAETNDWRQIDLESHPVSLKVNQTLFGKGTGAAVLGHPIQALAWLANELPRFGKQLKQNNLITTGVCMDVYIAKAGDRLEADFGVLGSIDLSIN